MASEAQATQFSLASAPSYRHVAVTAPLASIQILRAVAALAVLFSHQKGGLVEFGYLPNPIPAFDFGASGVDLFFVISGFIMVYTSERFFGQPDAARRFLARRLIRVVPLYWALTTVAVFGWHGMTLPSHLTWTNVIGSYLFIPTLRPNGSALPELNIAWTLYYEMFFYSLFAVTLVFQKRVAVFVLSTFLFGIVTVPSLVDVELGLPWSVWSSPIVYEFVFGMWIGLALREGWRLHPIISCVMVIGALALMIYTHNSGLINEVPLKADLSRPLMWGSGAALIVAAFALANFEAPVPKLAAPLLVIGEVSYALYLFHEFVPFMLHVIHVPQFIDPMFHPYSYSALTVVVAIACSFVLNDIDTKMRKWVLAKGRFQPTLGL